MSIASLENSLAQLFDGLVAVVTGGGSGIGRAACLLFSREGARVTVADISREGGEETAEMIRGEGGEAICVAGDVSDTAIVSTMVHTTVQRFGRLDCAFNNAGITHPRDHEWDEEAFQRTFDVNVKSVMQCMKREIGYMLEHGGGTIVNTSSVAGLVASGAPALPAYTASKHAVIGLTKTAALAYARNNIRVNALCPGVTRTRILDGPMSLGPDVQRFLENCAPLGRMATAEEMAEAAIWLCSAKSSFVTGHSLIADGGYTSQ